MCRLFGFRSVLMSQVHQSLIGAENALAMQSEDHPDGWGVAYYLAGAPHLVKSVKTAIDDQLFQRVGGIVTAQTVVAHLRKATIGTPTIINTHPFQHGYWTFAHNGNIRGFAQKRHQIIKLIAEPFRRYILGQTDSEAMFYLLLTAMQKRFDVHQGTPQVHDIAEATREVVQQIVDIVGDYSAVDDGDPQDTYLTFLLSNGQVMVGYQAGKHLYYSTHKTKCPERLECPFFAPECESPRKKGRVNHLVFSSEPLSGDNIWNSMRNNQVIAVDRSMNLWIDPV